MNDELPTGTSRPTRDRRRGRAVLDRRDVAVESGRNGSDAGGEVTR
ncbi:hypothetical protein NDI76_15285 [Halogeometricum sp. S1BR25-6]|uniref:Uncharacterized protein n=1 Tax=Halogeometricum salsisoli TaxID=2950536 RepID=A0ABU2GH13_9EURY|nr:hypothetical protein [Halogeometricum sp. S1BR25-6]MDS0300108.1 hypothetical protein [Halogeometricum sp. S1BR25-6]